MVLSVEKCFIQISSRIRPETISKMDPLDFPGELFTGVFHLPGKHRKVPFFKATVAGFGGKVDGN